MIKCVFRNMRRKQYICRPCNMAGKSKCEQTGMIVRVLLVAFLFQLLCPVTAFAAEPKTIRVGYFAFPGYHEVYQDENGLQGSGYGFDFCSFFADTQI